MNPSSWSRLSMGVSSSGGGGTSTGEIPCDLESSMGVSVSSDGMIAS